MKKLNASLLLKIAAAITILYFAAHIAGYPWTPVLTEKELIVVDGMKSHQFMAEGTQRTYWDFYVGFGVIIGSFLFIQGVMMWQLSTIAKTDASKLRFVIMSFIVLFVANGFLAWKYFFPMPILFVALIVASLCFSLYATRAEQKQKS
jgi:hypothetical protein